MWILSNAQAAICILIETCFPIWDLQHCEYSDSEVANSENRSISVSPLYNIVVFGCFTLHCVTELLKRLSLDGLGEGAEDQKGPLSQRQICTQKEWKTSPSDLEQWKRLQERASFQPTRQNISLQWWDFWMSDFSPIMRYFKHFWWSFLVKTPPEVITAQLVSAVISWKCGNILIFPPNLLPQQPLLFSGISWYYITQTASGHQSHRTHSTWINHSAWRSNQSLDDFSHKRCTQCDAILHCTLLKGLQTKAPRLFPPTSISTQFHCHYQLMAIQPVFQAVGGPAGDDVDLTWHLGRLQMGEFTSPFIRIKALKIWTHLTAQIKGASNHLYINL